MIAFSILSSGWYRGFVFKNPSTKVFSSTHLNFCMWFMGLYELSIQEAMLYFIFSIISSHYLFLLLLDANPGLSESRKKRV